MSGIQVVNEAVVYELQQTVSQLRHQLDQSRYAGQRELNKAEQQRELAEQSLEQTIIGLRDLLEEEKRHVASLQQQIERQKKAAQSLYTIKESEFQQHIHQVRENFELEIKQLETHNQKEKTALQNEIAQLKEIIFQLRSELEICAANGNGKHE